MPVFRFDSVLAAIEFNVNAIWEFDGVFADGEAYTGGLRSDPERIPDVLATELAHTDFPPDLLSLGGEIGFFVGPK